MLKISLIDSNDFVISTTLDDTVYKLHFAWNDYSGFWTIDFRDSDNTDLVRGIVVVPNFPLLNQYKVHNLPKGELMAVINNNTKQQISRNDFVDGVASLVYIPRSELNAILEA